MIKINVVAVGRLKEKFWEDGVKEYTKWLEKYCECRVIEIPDGRSPEAEGAEIKKKLSGCVIACDVQGKLISSEDLAEMIDKKASAGKSELTFLIGGSAGLSAEVKSLAEEKISFGRVTFPHLMMRVILCEQIYRAFTILHHTPYHK